MKQSIQSFRGHATQEEPVKLGLALQGGGALGAFTAGALESLVQSEAVQSGRVQVRVVSGTSAGAMNGAVLTHALNSAELDLSDRLKMAERDLNGFWSSIGENTQFLTTLNSFNKQAAAFMGLGHLFPDAGHKTPVQWPNLPDEEINAMHKGGGRGALEGLHYMLRRYAPHWDRVMGGDVNFSANAVRLKDPKGGFIRSNMEHVLFNRDTLTREATVASGALKILGAHLVHGVPHYDGAYLKNPDFAPFQSGEITDLLTIVIQDKPKGKILPVSQEEIVASGTMQEDTTVGREIHHHLEFLRKQKPEYDLHTIALEHEDHWGTSVRYNTDRKWLETLQAKGREAGQEWLKTDPFRFEARPSARVKAEVHPAVEEGITAK